MKRLLIICAFISLWATAQVPTVWELDYDEVYQFEDGFALTIKDHKYGIINANLEVIIPPILDNIRSYDLSPYYFNNELHATVDGKSVIYDTLGQIVKQYDELLEYEQVRPNEILSQERKIGPYRIRTGSNRYYEFGSSDWGCIHENGDTIVPFKFNFIEPGCTPNSFAGINQINRDYYTQFYYPDGTNHKTYYGVYLGWPSANCLWQKTTNGFVAVNDNLEILDSTYFEDVYIFKDRCWVTNGDSCYALNTKRKVIEKIKCDYFIKNRYWNVMIRDEKIALINDEGIQITDFIYTGRWTHYVATSTTILAMDKDYHYVLDKDGKLLKKFVLTKSTEAED